MPHTTPPNLTAMLAATFGMALLAACEPPATTAPAADRAGQAPGAPRSARVREVVSAGPVERDAPVNAAFWSAGGGRSVVLAAAGIAGLQVYGPDGKRIGAIEDINAGLVTVVDDTDRRFGAPLVVVYDAAQAAVRGFRLDLDPVSVREVMPVPLSVEDELTGLCHYRSALSGADYLYAVTDGGMIHQFEVFVVDDEVRAQLLRSIPSGKGSGFCSVDPRDGMLYVSEESTGIWRLGAEPESDTTREPLDLRAPFGRLSDDLKGLAVYPVNAEVSYLVVADVGENRMAVYELPDGELRGVFTVEGLHEAEGVTAGAAGTGDRWPDGVVAIADESPESGGPAVRLVSWRSIAEPLSLQFAEQEVTYRRPAVVRPVLETAVMPSYGDAADDPAIWVHPSDPSQSLVIGTDKQSGLFVYDLEGRVLQRLPDGQMNNVDLRAGFPLGDGQVTLLTASNRSNDSIAVYRIDEASRRLVAVADGVLATGFDDPYGLCMYKSSRSGEFYVFVNEGSVGIVRQWRLFDTGASRVGIERVREFEVGSQAEGCVADDEFGHLYVAEEDRGLWKYSAEPDGGDARHLIDETGDGGRLTDDVEGVSLWQGQDGDGFIVVSNQGADNYALYRRGDENAFAGFFHVVANAPAGIDGSSETDGLDVVSAPLGDAFPAGLLVVQDGRNIAPEERQNFKYVSWADIAAALDL